MSSPSPDLSACDRELIHIPGSIQPHGILLTLSEPGYTVTQVSENVAQWLGRGWRDCLGASLTDLFGPSHGPALAAGIRQSTLEGNPVFLRTVSVRSDCAGEAIFHALAHRHAGVLILELEKAETASEVGYQNQYLIVRDFMRRIQQAGDVPVLARLAAEEIRRISQFDRVLVYKFDPDWHGHVIAEAQEGSYPPYLDLWFPSSDIPRQARQLYQINRVRLIADSAYQAVPIQPRYNPAASGPLDLSFSVLRSVSPVHLEYLRNMGVAASMSLSILTEGGRLWGLFACHHRTPLVVPFEARAACDFLVQALSVQLEAIEQRLEYQRRIHLKSLTARLLGFMAQEESFTNALVNHPGELLEFCGASGAAILSDGQRLLVGSTPSEDQVSQIVEFLVNQGSGDIYSTDCLSAVLPGADKYCNLASGVFAVSISKVHQSYLLWFRPEVVQTVNWAGDPRKPVEPSSDSVAQLHPRQSFETWKETVRGRSLPWQPAETEAVAELRNAVIGIVLRRAEELAQLNSELQRSNKELESFSYSISHDLRAPFRHVSGYAELLLQSPTAKLSETDQRYVQTIIKSAQFAGVLVDKLLSFSQVARTKLQLRSVDMDVLAREVRREIEFSSPGSRAEWRIDKLPTVQGDVVMLRIVWQNLLQNAVKYSRQKSNPIIEVGALAVGGETVFHIRDNGVGFDQLYADKLFGVFQRLHRMEDFEGTGIGLANVRRIIERHGGRTWAQGEVDQGAVFYFSIPDVSVPENN